MIDQHNIKQFRKAYKKAVKDDVDGFTFEGHDVYTGFAKYVIEYFDMQMSPPC